MAQLDFPTALHAGFKYENTLISIMKFLKGSGVYEKGMQIRVGSWSHRPCEIGIQINENRPGSLAHTANEIVKAW